MSSSRPESNTFEDVHSPHSLSPVLSRRFLSECSLCLSPCLLSSCRSFLLIFCPCASAFLFLLLTTTTSVSVSILVLTRAPLVPRVTDGCVQPRLLTVAKSARGRRVGTPRPVHPSHSFKKTKNNASCVRQISTVTYSQGIAVLRRCQSSHVLLQTQTAAAAHATDAGGGDDGDFQRGVLCFQGQ